MAQTETFHCSVITPERAVLECKATFVAFPAHDGEIGVQVHRAPLICKLGIGVLRVESPDGQRLLFIDGGFAQIVANQLTILTQQAQTVQEIDRSRALAALEQAHAMKITTDESWLDRDRAIRRAQAQMKLLDAAKAA